MLGTWLVLLANAGLTPCIDSVVAIMPKAKVIVFQRRIAIPFLPWPSTKSFLICPIGSLLFTFYIAWHERHAARRCDSRSPHGETVRSMPPARIKLIERQQDLRDDQDDDGPLQPGRAVGVDNVGQCMGGLHNDVEFALQRARPLLQLVFVLEPGI